METRRLELLVALARLGSMREVADEMGVTTSTVSQQIAALAREAGTALVEPVGRRVRLTPAGRRVGRGARSHPGGAGGGPPPPRAGRRCTPHASTWIRRRNRPASYAWPGSPPRSGALCCPSSRIWQVATRGWS